MRNGSSIESAAYDGRLLSEWGDVVVITVNHRLNTIGFLDLSSFGEKYEGSANAGLLDLAAALQWIHTNIANFGGDPDNVTIFGQSGGGSKCTALMRMPSAIELFDNVGVISGGATTIQDNSSSARVGELTVELLGLTAETVDEIQTLPYDTVLAASNEALELAKAEEGFTAYSFGPVADGKYIMSDFLDLTGKNVVVSQCFSESAFASYKAENGDGRHNEWSDEESLEWIKLRYGEKSEAMLEEFRKLFPEKSDANLYFYNIGGYTSIKNKSAAFASAGATVYDYMFNYEAPTNGGTTAFHCVDLIYLFHNVDDPRCAIATGANEDAHRIQDQLAGAFVNMMYNGTPSTDELPWTPYAEGECNLMKFDVESGCVTFDDSELMAIYNAE